MRLKRDFVTNSSSTSFIVILPKNFDLDSCLSIKEHSNDKDLARALLPDEIQSASSDQPRVDRMICRVTKENIKNIINQPKAVYYEEDDYFLYMALRNLFEELGLKIHQFDTSSSDGKIIFLHERDIENTLDKYKNIRRKEYNEQ
jgi:hypothetical protein